MQALGSDENCAQWEKECATSSLGLLPMEGKTEGLSVFVSPFWKLKVSPHSSAYPVSVGSALVRKCPLCPWRLCCNLVCFLLNLVCFVVIFNVTVLLRPPASALLFSGCSLHLADMFSFSGCCYGERCYLWYFGWLQTGLRLWACFCISVLNQTFEIVLGIQGPKEFGFLLVNVPFCGVSTLDA